jgi:hypothetical protein
MVCIGTQAGRFGDNDDTVIIGQRSIGKGFGSVVLGCDALNDNVTHEECIVIGCAASSTATNEITLQASVANIIKATPTTITHQGVSIAGDFKSNGSVPMSGNLDMNTHNILDLRTSDTKIRLGNLSGDFLQQQDSIAIGNQCGQTSQGAFSVGVGLSCANANQGQQCVALGYNSQNSGSNNNSTALGALSGETNQHSKSICINANTSALNSTAEDQIKLKAGVTELTYDVDGFVIANNVDTIGIAEGSLRTLGGITSTKNMYCGANLYVIGDVKTNLTMDNNSITNVNDISTLSLNLNNGNISNVLDPTSAQDASTKNYVDTNINNPNYLKLTGGIMTGNITNLRTNDNNVSLGLNSNAGTFGVSLGNEAGQNTPPTFGTHIGYRCGKNTASAYSTALGFECQQDNSGSGSIGVGYRAGYQNHHANSLPINANITALNSTASNQMILKAGTTTLQADTTGLTYNSNNIEGDYKANGSVPMTGDLDMNTNNIINVVDPVNPQDVATKNYNDTINSIVPTGGYLDIYGGLYVGSLTHRRPIMSSGYTMITDGDIVIAAVAPTSLLTNSTGLGSLTVPANVMKIGSTSHWTMSGNIESGTNGETLNIYFYSGVTQILSKTFNLASKIDAGSSFRFVGDVVCRAIGGVGVGEIYTIGQLSVGTVNQSQSITVNVSQLSNIDTTIDNTFDVRCSYGSADLANRIQARHLTNYNIYQPQ